MLRFERENAEHVQIKFEDQFMGEFTLMDGHWYCTLNVELTRQAFEEILKRFQLLHGFEPPYYKDGKITVTTAIGKDRRTEFPISEFVRVEEFGPDNIRAIVTQTQELGIKNILSLDTTEDIIGAVEYGKKRILTEGTHADPG